MLTMMLKIENVDNDVKDWKFWQRCLRLQMGTMMLKIENVDSDIKERKGWQWC